jgi:hypothetical protein
MLRGRVATGMTFRSLAVLAGVAIGATLPATAAARPAAADPAARPAAAGAQPAAAAAAGAQTRRGRVYVARLRPVRADIAAYSATSARARVRVRGRRGNAFISARALFPRRVHRWALTRNRCTGPRVRNWTYQRLRADRRGRARATGRSLRFRFPRGARRYVVVFQPRSTELLLCGRLRARRV